MNGVTGATSWLPRPVPPSFRAGDVPDVANALRVPGITWTGGSEHPHNQLQPHRSTARQCINQYTCVNR